MAGTKLTRNQLAEPFKDPRTRRAFEALLDQDTSPPTYQVVATDADFTITREASQTYVLHTGTLTANRAVTLSTSGAVAGDAVLLTRTGAGAFNLSIAGKALATNTWASAVFDGSAWLLTAYGSLDGVPAPVIPPGSVTPADLSTGGPVWDTAGNLTALGHIYFENNPDFNLRLDGPFIVLQLGPTAGVNWDSSTGNFYIVNNGQNVFSLDPFGNMRVLGTITPSVTP